MSRDARPDRQAPAPRADDHTLDAELALLLDALRASAPAGGHPALRARLFERVARSAAASRPMFTVRARQAPLVPVAPGVAVRTLYRAERPELRPGEPLRVSWIELAAGTRWALPRADGHRGLQREWLVVQGRAAVGGREFTALDYHVDSGGGTLVEALGGEGATLYLRESPALGEGRLHEGDGWHEFAPGIRRRVLWTRGSEAAMLYRAEAGAAVPRHGHGHDEECLMLDGELFIDDVLLRGGEYQLAPAGSGHGGLFTDTGVVIFAHGDLDLAITDSAG